MSQQVINVGSGELAGDGESLRAAFIKVNANFTELYTATVSQSVDFLNIASHVLPATDLTYDLGSPTRQWRSLYVGTSTIYIGGTTLTIDQVGQLLVDGNPISSTTDRLTNGDSELVLNVGGGNNPFITFPAYQGGELQLQGEELAAISGNLSLTSVGRVIITSNLAQNPLTWAFDNFGSLNVPQPQSTTFTAVMDGDHMVDAIGFTEDAWWHFDVTFTFNSNGTVVTTIENNTPWISNPET